MADNKEYDEAGGLAGWAGDDKDQEIALLRARLAQMEEEQAASRTVDAYLERKLAEKAAQLAALENAEWLTIAHGICADFGIPPGHILHRMRELKGRLDGVDDRITDQQIIDLAVAAGYGIIHARETPPTYEMRRAMNFARAVLRQAFAGTPA